MLEIRYDDQVLHNRAILLRAVTGTTYETDGWVAVIIGVDRKFVFARRFLNRVRGFETPHSYHRFDVSSLCAGDVLEIGLYNRKRDRFYFQVADIDEEGIELLPITGLDVVQHLRVHMESGQ